VSPKVTMISFELAGLLGQHPKPANDTGICVLQSNERRILGRPPKSRWLAHWSALTQPPVLLHPVSTTQAHPG